MAAKSDLVGMLRHFLAKAERGELLAVELFAVSHDHVHHSADLAALSPERAGQFTEFVHVSAATRFLKMFDMNKDADKRTGSAVKWDDEPLAKAAEGGR